eukprot:gene9330-16461_t
MIGFQLVKGVSVNQEVVANHLALVLGLRHVVDRNPGILVYTSFFAIEAQQNSIRKLDITSTNIVNVTPLSSIKALELIESTD